MIQQILIKNFQSHKNTNIQLDKGVNVIVGATDSGKTAIIRALRWLVWGKPAGDAFRSHWGGNTVVTVCGDFDGNEYIERGIDEKGSYYILHDKILRAFGQNVPEEVTGAFNMDEINLQQQLDSPFLLTESPGKVASFFNKIANLDKIDLSNANLQKEIRQTTNLIRYKENDVQTKEELLKRFDYLTAMEQDLLRIERLQRNKEIKIQKKKNLGFYVNGLTTIKEREREINQLLKCEKEINALSNFEEGKRVLTLSVAKLANAVYTIKGIDRKIEKINRITELEGIVNTTLQNIEEERAFSLKITAFRNIVNKVQAVLNKLVLAEDNVVRLGKLFAKNMPDVCPLCETPITKKHKH